MYVIRNSNFYERILLKENFLNKNVLKRYIVNLSRNRMSPTALELNKNCYFHLKRKL